VAEHTRFRRALAPAFSAQAVKAQGPLISSYADTLIQKPHEEVEGKSKEVVIDLVAWINFTTFDIISDLGWGTSFRGLEKQKYHPWITVILQFKAILIANSIAYYPLLNALVPYVTPKSALAGLNLVFDTARENVRARLKRKMGRPDVMSFVETGEMSEEIVANSTVLIVAGSETLTMALVGKMHYLLENEGKMERLVREIREGFWNEKDIDGQTTRWLSYLTAVLQEGMRLCPPIPDNLHREVPAGGATIAGRWLPRGTAVGVPCHSMFRSEENFAKPEEFIPERWLDGEGFGGDKNEAFYPFGVGPSGCMGQLVWVEMRVILARTSLEV
jgi:cytochrome P450